MLNWLDCLQNETTGSVDKSLQAPHSVLSDKYAEDKAGGELAKHLGLKVCDQPCKDHLTGRCHCHLI